jgi:hypothetical protein
MANFKRGKSKRNVVCTMCTEHRWRGNAKGRFKEKEEAIRHREVFDGEVTPAPRTTKSPRRQWSKNKKVRSLRARLKHLRKKLAEYEARPVRVSNRFRQMILDSYTRDIARCEKELVELLGER